MNKKIKVGIWGLGRAGIGMHLPETRLYPEEFEVVAGCDIDPSRCEELKKAVPNVRTYTDGDEFLKDPEMELVAVAVRSPDHVSYDIRALEAGKYVFAEKPTALTLEGLERLRKAAEKHPGKIFFRQNRRYEACFNHVREIINSGILGNVYEIKLCRHSWQFRDDWQTLISCGGGQLNNWGPHLIDQGLQFLESPLKDLWSDLKLVAARGDAEDHLKVIMRGENGRVIDIEISGGVALASPVYAVYGDRGSLVSPDEQDIQLKYLHPDFKIPDVKSSPDTPPLKGGFGGKVAPRWVRKTIMVEPSNKYNLNSIYHEMYLAIREGKPFAVTMEEALEVVKVINMVKAQNPAFKPVPDSE